MSNAKHTPDLKHTEKCVSIPECQSNHTNATVTAEQLPTSTLSAPEKVKDLSAAHAENAEPKKFSANGETSKQRLSESMAVSVHVAASNILSFLQSITLTETAKSIETQDLGDISFINGLLNKDTRKKILDCCVSTVIALAANTENALTKKANNTQPISQSPTDAAKEKLEAAAPDMAEALQKIIPYAMQLLVDKHGTVIFEDYNWLMQARAALAKAGIE